MHNLYLRIYGTVVAVLLLFALVAGWMAKHSVEHELESNRVVWMERAAGWASLIESELPPPDAPDDEQREVMRGWSARLRLPMALDDAQGRRIGASDSYLRRERDGDERRDRAVRLPLSDGRTLWVIRPGGGPARIGPRDLHGPPGFGPPWPSRPGVGLGVLLVVLFVAVALGAYPVVRRLTRRLEALKRGVETFGAGNLSFRIDDRGRDEVAAVASSFNDAAGRIEGLIRANRSLLANASHELRSPLARLKMALSLLDDARDDAQRDRLKREISRNVGELDELVEEVLLASRLEGVAPGVGDEAFEPVSLLGIAAEEAVPYEATVQGEDLMVRGSERLLRRALRNLLENARRYGGEAPPDVQVRVDGGRAQVEVADRGPGVPEDQRQRIFEPFYRMPGHAEHAGGIGLGLSLVRQIAQRHGGEVQVLPRAGGGSRFVISLPAATA